MSLIHHLTSKTICACLSTWLWPWCSTCLIFQMSGNSRLFKENAFLVLIKVRRMPRCPWLRLAVRSFLSSSGIFVRNSNDPISEPHTVIENPIEDIAALRETRHWDLELQSEVPSHLDSQIWIWTFLRLKKGPLFDVFLSEPRVSRNGVS